MLLIIVADPMLLQVQSNSDTAGILSSSDTVYCVVLRNTPHISWGLNVDG